MRFDLQRFQYWRKKRQSPLPLQLYQRNLAYNDSSRSSSGNRSRRNTRKTKCLITKHRNNRSISSQDWSTTKAVFWLFSFCHLSIMTILPTFSFWHDNYEQTIRDWLHDICLTVLSITVFSQSYMQSRCLQWQCISSAWHCWYYQTIHQEPGKQLLWETQWCQQKCRNHRLPLVHRPYRNLSRILDFVYIQTQQLKTPKNKTSIPHKKCPYK